MPLCQYERSGRHIGVVRIAVDGKKLVDGFTATGPVAVVVEDE